MRGSSARVTLHLRRRRRRHGALRDAGGAVTRLVLVPSFATTGTVVLVNLQTLACHPVTFSTAPLADA